MTDILGSNWPTIKINFTAVGCDYLIDNPNQRGFTCAIRTQQAVDAAFRHINRYTVERPMIGVLFDNIPGLKHIISAFDYKIGGNKPDIGDVKPVTANVMPNNGDVVLNNGNVMLNIGDVKLNNGDVGLYNAIVGLDFGKSGLNIGDSGVILNR